MPSISDFRADTPGAGNRLHFNNAGSGLMPRPVLDAMLAHLQLEASIGGYEAEAAMRGEVEAFYPSVARLIGARPEEIAFSTSATDSYNKALSAIPFQPGDVILTTTDDYVSNQIAFIQAARRFGARVVRASNLPEGGVDMEHMTGLMDRHRPRLVAVTHVPTNSGLVQPVTDIGARCRARGLTYLVDACQSAGQLQLDVSAIGCDFLCATFRKFLRGPRGAGFLFVAGRQLEAGAEPLFLDLHSARWTADDAYDVLGDARRFELWERSFALVLGSRAAADYAMAAGAALTEARVRELGDSLRRGLAAIDGIRVLDRGASLCGIVTLTAAGWQPGDFKAAFDRRRINSSLSFAEFARIDFRDKQTEWALRVSPHYYNSEEEVDTFIAAAAEIMRDQK